MSDSVAAPTGQKSFAIPAGAGLGLFLLWLVALNMRTGLIGIGPVLPTLTDDLGLSKTEGSLLVALPPALMGLCAIPGGRLVDRIGAMRVVTVGLAVVGLSTFARALAVSFPMMVLLTALFGAGVGVTQPALVRFSRGLMPTRVGVTTGVLAAGFFAGAVIPALLTAPFLLGSAADGWRWPLLLWSIIALVSLVVWLACRNRWSIAGMPSGGAHANLTGWSPWRNRSAWVVALIFAGQGIGYYLLVAWLPSVYEEHGVSDNRATLLYAIFTVSTFPAMAGMPPLSDRIGSRKIPCLISAVTFLIGSVGMVVALDAPGLEFLWPALSALGVAGLFGMGLLMPIDVSPPGATGIAAGMVLFVGYGGSSLGPILGGAVRDSTGSFGSALELMPFLALVLIALSFFAPKPGAQAIRR